MSHKTPSRQLFSPLPPGVDMSTPAHLKWMLDQHATHIQNHEDRLMSLELSAERQSQKPDKSVETPLGKLPLPIVLLIIGWLLYVKPDLAFKLIAP